MLVQIGRRFVAEQSDIDHNFTKQLRELLLGSNAFKDCHEEFIRDLIVSASRKTFEPNRFLMEEGSLGDSMFVLCKGVVEVTSSGRHICRLREGSIVGEAALLSIDNKRASSVRSIEKCDVAIIFRATFHTILEKYPWEKRKFHNQIKAKLVELGKLADTRLDVNFQAQAIQSEALKKVNFFAEDESLHTFAEELAMGTTSYWYRPGRLIIHEGDAHCDAMYVLLSGAVEITAFGEFLGRLEGDIFGEVCALDLLERRTANVTAATACQILLVPKHVLVPLLAKFPAVRTKLLRRARQRLVALNAAVLTAETSSLTPSHIPHHHTNQPGCAFGFGRNLNMSDAILFAADTVWRGARVDLLNKIASRIERRTYREERIIYDQGQRVCAATDFFYWIASGQVEIWKDGTHVDILAGGDFAGLHPLIVASPISVAAGVLKPAATFDHKALCKTNASFGVINLYALQGFLRDFPDAALMERLEEVFRRRTEEWGRKAESARATTKRPQLDVMFMKTTIPDSAGNISLSNRLVMDKSFELRRDERTTLLPMLPLTAR